VDKQDEKDIIYACVALCQELSADLIRQAEKDTDLELMRFNYHAAQGALKCAARLIQAAHEVE
jgi:hypothetical protein